MAVSTTSGEEIAYTGDFVKDNNTPRWNNRTEKYITAQAVFNARAVARSWTDGEMAKIESRNNEYGREQQQAARYECRRIMKTVVTCKIVKKGLLDPLMREVATKIAEECTSTDGFKAKLTQIEEFNQRAKPQNRQTTLMGQKGQTTVAQYAMANQKKGKTQYDKKNMRREKKVRTCQGCKQRCYIFIGHTDEECWYNTQTLNDNTPSCTWCELHQASSAHKDHAIDNCWKRADHNAKRAEQQRAKLKEQHTIQMKKDKTKDFANGEW
jgi:hypothetical protein